MNAWVLNGKIIKSVRTVKLEIRNELHNFNIIIMQESKYLQMNINQGFI